MSINDINKRIVITRLDTGDKEVLHDYFKLPSDIKDKYLMIFLNAYLENNIPFTLEYGYNI